MSNTAKVIELNTTVPFCIAPRPRRDGPSLAEFAQAAAERVRRVIPAEFKACADLDTAAARLSFPASEAVAIARRIFAGTVRRVTVVGISGSGKTTAAALIVGELSRMVEATYSKPETDPLGRPRHFWDGALEWRSADALALDADGSRPGDGDSALLCRMLTAPIAIIDDLGNERGRFPGSNSVPPRVLQMRFDAGLVTIVTLGLNRDEVLGKYGAGLQRRLADMRDPMLAIVGQPSKAVAS